jgi:hypothetical protein
MASTSFHRWGGLELNIARRVGTAWTETYQLRNTSDAPVTIGSIGICTPWRDVYSSSRDSLHRAVHAHIWTGGADSWVWACRWTDQGQASA